MTATNQPIRLGMFAKYWEPGSVKTRLARAIGETVAAEVYAAFVRTQVERYSQYTDPVLAFTPGDRAAEFERLVQPLTAHWQLQPQSEGDLGQRMRGYFEQAFAAGYERVLLVGSDTPTLPLKFIHQAHALLLMHDVVLGPSEDGGYYLLAARRQVPPVFTGIEWGSDQVFFRTMDKLQESRMLFAVLPTWYDVDDQADLDRLRAELSMSRDELDQNLKQQLDQLLPS